MGSKQLFEESKKYLVGGVNSPVRSMKPFPFFSQSGKGSRLYDVDGNSYIDYCLAYGPLILGHSHPRVVEAIKEQVDKGVAYGTPTELEKEFAQRVTRAVPNVDMVRVVNSGTEATMAALRLARGYTGRDKILKFEGAFHGAHDGVLVQAGSGATTHGVPKSKGVPQEAIENTLLAPFNDEEAVERVLEENGGEIAAIILEPVIGNAGCILPREGYLERLRELATEQGIMLIFDEVMTGFRVAHGGAQEYFGVDADIVTLGKIAGGGLPIGVIASSREVMENFSPSGKVYQAGTFNGNPLSMAAGVATLKELEGGVYSVTEPLTKKLTSGLSQVAEDIGIEGKVYSAGSMFQIYFSEGEVYDYSTAQRANADLFLEYEREMLQRGVFLPPSQYECNFMSSAHSEEDIESTLEKAEESMKALK